VRPNLDIIIIFPVPGDPDEKLWFDLVRFVYFPIIAVYFFHASAVRWWWELRGDEAASMHPSMCALTTQFASPYNPKIPNSGSFIPTAPGLGLLILPSFPPKTNSDPD
jgi:hypothetical protein